MSMDLLVLLIITLSVSIIFSIYYNKLKNEKKELQLKQEQLLSENNTLKTYNDTIQKQNYDLATQLSALSERANILESENTNLKNKIDTLNNEYIQLKSEKSTYIEKIKNLETTLQNQQSIQEQLKKEFELISSRILETNTQKLTEQNQQVLGNTIMPIKDYIKQIQEIENKIQRYYDEENKDRASLKTIIEDLNKKNEEVRQTANKLANALTSQVKYQGNWGELILENLLEISGLQKGIDYEVQKKDSDKQPDVIIKLPENKHIIIDAKVTLSALVNYHSAQTDEEKEKYTKDIIQSIEIHYKNLSKKEYEKIPSLNSIDLVLMFIPIESVMTIIHQYRPEIFNNAIRERILIVTPTSLLSTLRAIHYIRQQEKQKQDIETIVSEIAKLYEKIRIFTNHFYEVKKAIEKAQEKFDEAETTLIKGKGNAMSIIVNKIHPYINPKEPITKFLPEEDTNEN